MIKMTVMKNDVVLMWNWIFFVDRINTTRFNKKITIIINGYISLPSNTRQNQLKMVIIKGGNQTNNLLLIKWILQNNSQRR